MPSLSVSVAVWPYAARIYVARALKLLLVLGRSGVVACGALEDGYGVVVVNNRCLGVGLSLGADGR